jgi:hypothetical protein
MIAGNGFEPLAGRPPDLRAGFSHATARLRPGHRSFYGMAWAMRALSGRGICSLRVAGLTSRDWLAGRVHDNPVAELVGQCVDEAAGHRDRRVAAVTSSADTAGYA